MKDIKYYNDIKKKVIADAYKKGYEENTALADNNVRLICKFNSDELIAKGENLAPLLEYLKNNKEDIWMKGRVLEEIHMLENYVNEILNDESEAIL
ncbi:MAG TPA: hypothetical protein VIK26_00570 [Clostridium sp.]